MSDPCKIDMSPEAITRRLKETSRLRDLCLRLGKADCLGTVAAPEEKEDPPPERTPPEKPR